MTCLLQRLGRVPPALHAESSIALRSERRAGARRRAAGARRSGGAPRARGARAPHCPRTPSAPAAGPPPCARRAAAQLTLAGHNPNPNPGRLCQHGAAPLQHSGPRYAACLPAAEECRPAALQASPSKSCRRGMRLRGAPPGRAGRRRRRPGGPRTWLWPAAPHPPPPSLPAPRAPSWTGTWAAITCGFHTWMLSTCSRVTQYPQHAAPQLSQARAQTVSSVTGTAVRARNSPRTGWRQVARGDGARRARL